jgi:hypothetical protein
MGVIHFGIEPEISGSQYGLDNSSFLAYRLSHIRFHSVKGGLTHEDFDNGVA